MADRVAHLKEEKECPFCENDDLSKIAIAPDGEVVCQECGTVLGRIATPPRKEASGSTAEQWSGAQDDAERTLEDHVSRYGWDF